MLSKKHYEAIARIASDNYRLGLDAKRRGAEGDWGRWMICNLADYFAADNPKFDRSSFLKACGLEG